MKVKICGITNAADATAAVEAGADLLGFIFYPPSPRFVTPEAARDIIAQVPAGVEKVGVFVNESVSRMQRVSELAGLTVLQLHGDEDAEQIAAATGLKCMKAVALRSLEDLRGLENEAGYVLLVDTPTPQYGGSGQVGDWELASLLARRRPIFLAGGLTPENVGDAVATVRPAGVDVSSGVESKPGQKDHDRVRAFIGAARRAGEGL